jgi:hypothetical protein
LYIHTTLYNNAEKSQRNKRKASSEGKEIEKENIKNIPKGSLEKNVPEQKVPSEKNVPHGRKVFIYLCIDYMAVFINMYLLFIYYLHKHIYI